MIKHPETEHEALLEACLAALRAEAFVVGYIIQVDARAGSFARFRVTATMGCAESSLGFARRDGDDWTVLAIGVAFDAAFFRLHGVPLAIQASSAA